MRRFRGGVRSLSAVAVAPRRDRILICSCVAVITALAWAYLVHLDRQMSSSMQHDAMMAEMGMTMNAPWTTVDLALTFAMWTVMMVGMMAPAATPVLLLFARARAGRTERGVSMAVLIFGLGYIAVWVGFSACAALAQGALHRAALLSPAMSASSPPLAGAILIAAGVYQLTPFKGACLSHCRSPLGFLMTSWRDGFTGAFQMGSRHAGYCLGCCWALMCVLFAVGVMNLLWVAALTLVVFVEKAGPSGVLVARGAGAVMAILGICVVAGVW